MSTHGEGPVNGQPGGTVDPHGMGSPGQTAVSLPRPAGGTNVSPGGIPHAVEGLDNAVTGVLSSTPAPQMSYESLFLNNFGNPGQQFTMWGPNYDRTAGQAALQYSNVSPQQPVRDELWVKYMELSKAQSDMYNALSSQIKALEDRIVPLERENASLKEANSELTQIVAGISSQVTGFDTRVSNVESQSHESVNKVQRATSSIASRVADLESSDRAINSTLSALESRIVGVEGSLDTRLLETDTKTQKLVQLEQESRDRIGQVELDCKGRFVELSGRLELKQLSQTVDKFGVIYGDKRSTGREVNAANDGRSAAATQPKQCQDARLDEPIGDSVIEDNGREPGPGPNRGRDNQSRRDDNRGSNPRGSGSGHNRGSNGQGHAEDQGGSHQSSRGNNHPVYNAHQGYASTVQQDGSFYQAMTPPPGPGYPNTGFPAQMSPGQGYPFQGAPGYGVQGQGFPIQGFGPPMYPGQGYNNMGYPMGPVLGNQQMGQMQGNPQMGQMQGNQQMGQMQGNQQMGPMQGNQQVGQGPGNQQTDGVQRANRPPGTDNREIAKKFEKLPKFKGTGDPSWKTFIAYFERTCDKYGCAPDARADYLGDCLLGTAADFYITLSRDITRSYDQLSTALKNRFGMPDDPRNIRLKLGQMRQNDGETIQEFSQRIRALVRDLPDTPGEAAESLAIDAFLRGVLMKNAALMVSAQTPTTLEKTVQALDVAIVNQQFILGDRKVRQISVDDGVADVRQIQDTRPRARESDVDRGSRISQSPEGLEARKSEGLGIEEQVSEAIRKALAQFAPGFGRDRSRDRSRSPGNACFRCGKPGHFKRDCRVDIGRSRSPSPGPERIGRDSPHPRKSVEINDQPKVLGSS